MVIINSNTNKDLQYNQFSGLDRANRCIVDYLFNNAPDLWRLLYYTDKQPLFQPLLTTEQKSNMIAKDYTIDNITTTKNILFITETDETFSVAIPQIRIDIGDVLPINSYQSAVEIIFQIIIPNKLHIIQTEYNDVATRGIAIFRELAKALNGRRIDNSGFNSPLFMNRKAPEGVGRNNGAKKIAFNKHYKGYWVSFSVLI